MKKIIENQQVQLKNGLKTLFVHSPGSTMASVQIWFRAGSALELPENLGIAHFLEHMFFKGTPKRPKATIAHQVESFGGEINAFTSFDYTCYYINAPHTHLGDTIDILLDMVTNPLFAEEDILPERGVVFEEFRRSYDNPQDYLFHQIQRHAFSKEYSHPILGTEDNIKSFCRSQLLNFRKKYYNLSNALLIVAANITEREKLQEQIESYRLPAGPLSEFSSFSLASRPVLDIHQKETRMCTLALIAEGPNYEHPSAAAAELAISCLGYTESSKLYSELVTSSTLANSASASSMFMAKGGLHFISMVCPPSNLEQATQKFIEMIEKVIKEGFAGREVEKIKNQYLASKTFEMESLDSYAFSRGHGYAQNTDIDSEEKFIDRIRKTSVEEVGEALRKIFARPIHLFAQTPLGVKEKEVAPVLQKFQKQLAALSCASDASAPTVTSAPTSTTPTSSSPASPLTSPLTSPPASPPASAFDDSTSLEKKFSIQKSPHDSQVQMIELQDGLTFLYRQNTMTPTFVTNVYIRGGLTEELPQSNGLYHLLSSLFIKGYPGISQQDLKQDLDYKSADLDAFSGRNAYGFNLHGLSTYFRELSNHLINSILHPSITLKDLEHERELTLRALVAQKEKPAFQCFEQVHKIMFGQHPYSFNILGTPQTLATFSHSALEKLHQENLQNKPMVVTYCGDLPLEEVYGTLEPLFEKLSKLNKLNKRKAWALGTQTQLKSYRPLADSESFISMDREQTQIFMGIPCASSYNLENIYLKMITAHLSGQSSELFVEVRDRRGLCYSTQPVHQSFLEGGYWGIYLASGHDKVAPAVSAIKEIIEKFKTQGISEEEFNRIKEMMRGKNLLGLQTNEDYANTYSIPLLHGQSLHHFYEENDFTFKLNYGQFQENIKEILSRPLRQVIVGRGP